MAARTGLANLITRLRNMTQAGTADYTVSGTTYWSDNHLQDILDIHRVDIYREKLAVQETYDADGEVIFHEYYSSFSNLEEAASGTTIWVVTNAEGSHIGTADYTASYITGHLRFAVDQEGSARYLTARTYNLQIAAAAIWEHRMGNLHSAYSFSSDGQKFDRDQWFQHCVKMVEHYESLSGPQFVPLLREDLA